MPIHSTKPGNPNETRCGDKYGLWVLWEGTLDPQFHVSFDCEACQADVAKEQQQAPDNSGG